MTLFGFGKKKEKEINAPVCTFHAEALRRARKRLFWR